MQKFTRIIKHLFLGEIVINRFMCTIRVHLVLINHDAKAIASLSCYFYRILIIILEIDFLNKNFSTRLIVKTYRIKLYSLVLKYNLYDTIYCITYCTGSCLGRKRKYPNKNVVMIIWLTCNYSRVS